MLEERPQTQEPTKAYYVATIRDLRRFLTQGTITTPKSRLLQRGKSKTEQQRRGENIDGLKQLYAALSKHDPQDYAYMLAHPDGHTLLLSTFSKNRESRNALSTALNKISFPEGIKTIAQLEESIALVFHSELAPAVAKAQSILQASSYLRKAVRFPYSRHPIIIEVQMPSDSFDASFSGSQRLIHASQTGVSLQRVTRIHVHKEMPHESHDKLIELLSAAELPDVKIKTY